jgi:hypothetical protein
VRHIASIVKDGAVQYALVDEDTGEMTQFAHILVPDHFGLEQSALLGSNLVQAIGLNGRGHKRGGALRHPDPMSPQLELDTPPAPAPKKKGKGGRPKGGNLPGRYYVSVDDIGAVLREHDPDRHGMQIGDIATHVARAPEHKPWVIKSISNRVTNEKGKLRDGRATPFRFRTVRDGKVDRLFLSLAPDPVTE